MNERSERIQRLLDDEDLKQAFETVREHYRDLIEQTPIDSTNPEPLMDIRKMLQLLEDVKQNLYAAIQDGHMDDFRLQEKERLNVN